jgi:hypothetical protein
VSELHWHEQVTKLHTVASLTREMKEKEAQL